MAYFITVGLGKYNRIKTLEGRIVRYSDKIAYLNHDIDDSIRAGFLTEEALPKEIIRVLGKSRSERIDTLVNDIIRRQLTILMMVNME